MDMTFANPSLLAGIIFHSDGRRLTPSQSAKRGLLHRYYPEDKSSLHPARKAIRIPAGDVERLVLAQLSQRREHAAHEAGYLTIPSDDALSDRELVLATIEKIIVSDDAVTIMSKAMFGLASGAVTVPARLMRRGKEMRLANAP